MPGKMPKNIPAGPTTSGDSPRVSASSARVVAGAPLAIRSMSARGITYPVLSSSFRDCRSRS